MPYPYPTYKGGTRARLTPPAWKQNLPSSGNGLTYLSPEQAAALTPEARRTLAAASVRVNPKLSSPDPGAYGTATWWNGPLGPILPRVSLLPQAVGTDIPMHEDLHVLDAMYGGLSKTLVNTPETRKQLAAAYYGTTLHNPNFGSESHIPQTEAFAQAGMHGYNNIPSEMRPLYKRIFTPPAFAPRPQVGTGGPAFMRR